MGVLSRFERRLGGLVEGAFAKVFKGGVEPVELAAALREETDSRRVISATRTLVPNDFLIELSTRDHEHLVPYEQALAIELAEIVKDHAADQRYTFVGNVRVRFARNDSLDTGIFTVASGVIGPTAGVPSRPGEFPRVPPGAGSPVPPGMPAAGPDQFLASPDQSLANPGAPPPGPNVPPAWVPHEPPPPRAAGPPAAPSPAQPPGQPGGPWPPSAPPGGGARGAPPLGGRPAEGGQGMAAAAAWNTIPGCPRLVVASVGDGGQGNRGGEYTINGDHVLLGRTAESTIRLADTRVSRRHGEITRLAGAANGADVYIYRDLDSTNGSLVNGRRASRAELHNGDRIELGSTTLVFRVDPVGYPGYGPGPR
ncbi:MAG: FhaA domain-containing protein [Frankiaceae bacterium]